MPEIRVTIPNRMNKLLEMLIESGLFTSKADLMRFAMVAYLKELGWIEKLKDLSE